MIPAFPKIFTLGDRFSTNIWDGPEFYKDKLTQALANGN